MMLPFAQELQYMQNFHCEFSHYIHIKRVQSLDKCFLDAGPVLMSRPITAQLMICDLAKDRQCKEAMETKEKVTDMATCRQMSCFGLTWLDLIARGNEGRTTTTEPSRPISSLETSSKYM